MPKRNWFLIIGTVILMAIFIILALYLYSLYGWLGFLVASIPAVISEVLILFYSERRIVAQTKQKLTELRLLVKEDIKSEIGEEKRLLIEALNKKSKATSTNLENFRIYLRINTAELNELILEVDNTYLKCVDLVKKARTEKARELFSSTISKIFNRIYELDTDFTFKLGNLETLDVKFLKTINSFKEEWLKSVAKIKDLIKQTQEKFEINTNFIFFIEDIFRFEIEKQRRVENEDFESLEIPKDQIKQLLKYIDKTIKIKLNELAKEEKRKLGEVSKKVIEYYSGLNKKPNLPEMVINLGIGITESKEILSYLKEVGMIDEIKYHVE